MTPSHSNQQNLLVWRLAAMLSPGGLGEPRIVLTTNVFNSLFFFNAYYNYFLDYILYYLIYIHMYITYFIYSFFFTTHVLLSCIYYYLYFLCPMSFHVCYSRRFNFNGCFHSRCQAELHMGKNVQTAAFFYYQCERLRTFENFTPPSI